MENYKRQQENSYKYTLANTNLRAEKSTSANVITVIPALEMVQAIEAEEDWYEVLYKGQRGYIYIVIIYLRQNIHGQMLL